MGLRVVSSETAARRFKERGSAASKDYTDGVTGAGGKWAAATAASADNFAAGVQSAIADGRFKKGVEKAGAGKYEEAAKTIGSARFPQGIQAAGPRYQTAVQPYLSALASLDLDTSNPRRPRGDVSNYQRAQLVGTTLRAVKLGTR